MLGCAFSMNSCRFWGLMRMFGAMGEFRHNLSSLAGRVAGSVHRADQDTGDAPMPGDKGQGPAVGKHGLRAARDQIESFGDVGQRSHRRHQRRR